MVFRGLTPPGYMMPPPARLEVAETCGPRLRRGRETRAERGPVSRRLRNEIWHARRGASHFAALTPGVSVRSTPGL